MNKIVSGDAYSRLMMGNKAVSVISTANLLFN